MSPAPNPEPTPFYRLNADELALRVRSLAAGPTAPPPNRLRPLLRHSFEHRCWPFGRLGPGLVCAPSDDVCETLRRRCAAVQMVFTAQKFETVCHAFPPAVDPWLSLESAALLSGDGRVGLRVDCHRRDRHEEVVFSCTSLLPGGVPVVTWAAPPDPAVGPAWHFVTAPGDRVKDVLFAHLAAVDGRPVESMRPEDVPQTVLRLDWDLLDAYIARQALTPLGAAELAAVRRAMRGVSSRRATQPGRPSM